MPAPSIPTPTPEWYPQDDKPTGRGFMDYILQLMGLGIKGGTEFAQGNVPLPNMSQFAGRETTPNPAFPAPNLDKFGAQPNPNQPRQQFPIPNAMLQSRANPQRGRGFNRDISSQGGFLAPKSPLPPTPPVQHRGLQQGPFLPPTPPQASRGSNRYANPELKIPELSGFLNRPRPPKRNLPQGF